MSAGRNTSLSALSVFFRFSSFSVSVPNLERGYLSARESPCSLRALRLDLRSVLDAAFERFQLFVQAAVVVLHSLVGLSGRFVTARLVSVGVSSQLGWSLWAFLHCLVGLCGRFFTAWPLVSRGVSSQPDGCQCLHGVSSQLDWSLWTFLHILIGLCGRFFTA